MQLVIVGNTCWPSMVIVMERLHSGSRKFVVDIARFRRPHFTNWCLHPGARVLIGCKKEKNKLLVCFAFVSCFHAKIIRLFQPPPAQKIFGRSLTFQLFILLRAKARCQAYPIRLPIDYVRSFILFYFFVWLLSENFVIFTFGFWFFFLFLNRLDLRERFFFLLIAVIDCNFVFLLFPPIFQFFFLKNFWGVLCVCVGISSTRRGRRRRDDTLKVTVVRNTFFLFY
jgi:hypothetical protein